MVKLRFNITQANLPQGGNSAASGGLVSGGGSASGGAGGGDSNYPQVDTNGVKYADGPGSTIIGSGNANVDFDGSPGAYKVVPDPNGKYVINGQTYSSVGYENLDNAGKNNNWYGVQTDSNGQPIINADGTLNGTLSSGSMIGKGDDTAFVALSNQQVSTIRQTNPNFKLGDEIIVTNPDTGTSIRAAYADNAGNSGMNHTEVSPAAANALGVSYGKNSKGTSYANGNLQFSLP